MMMQNERALDDEFSASAGRVAPRRISVKQRSRDVRRGAVSGSQDHVFVGRFKKQMYVELRNSQFPIFKINQIHRLRQTGFLNVAQLVHHSVLFFPSNHFRRSATPMLYALPSLAAGSSLAYKALRICLSLVPMSMAASLTVTAMRSSNGDLEDTIHLSFLILS